MTIVLPGLPIPPSENAMYVNRRQAGKRGRAASDELRYFWDHMEFWRLKNLPFANSARRAMAGRSFLAIDCTFHFRRTRLYTGKGNVRRLDVSNRLKALHDSVAKLLGVDDSEFFESSERKLGDLPDSHREYVDVQLRTLDQSWFEGRTIQSPVSGGM